MADGTSATTVASAPAGAAELEAAVLVPADVDDDVGAAAADDVDDELLLLPHPTATTAHSSGSTAESHFLREPIVLPPRLNDTQKPPAG
jgi:hypothetical protein